MKNYMKGYLDSNSGKSSVRFVMVMISSAVTALIIGLIVKIFVDEDPDYVGISALVVSSIGSVSSLVWQKVNQKKIENDK